MSTQNERKEINHAVRKQVNAVIYHVARYMEIFLSILILIVIVFAGAHLIMEVFHTSVQDMDSTFFSTFLSAGLSLVVGVEFIKMLCQHSTQTVVEVLMFATARQMVVEHLNAVETLIGVIAIAVLFAVRKYLMTSDDDMVSHFRDHTGFNDYEETAPDDRCDKHKA